MLVAAVGLGVGFVAGLFGKGGSAVATPLLHAVGVPAVVALAAPLPATIPSTLAASLAWAGEGAVDRRVVAWSFWFGIPATVVGAWSTRWIDGGALVLVTEVVVVALGLRFLLRPGDGQEMVRELRAPRARLAGVAVVVGLAAGLLANSGGFLLAPLYLTVLRLPVKVAFASSLVVATVLAVPGTIVHTALGHVDWAVVVVFGSASVPLSFVGAKMAVRTDSHRPAFRGLPGLRSTPLLDPPPEKFSHSWPPS
ncbi:MAG: sulfite exporter TauE/SafE family protein [Acidimicrobiales bacterium]